MIKFISYASLKTVCMLLLISFSASVNSGKATYPAPDAGSKILKSQFTRTSVKTDGLPEKAWNSAELSVIDIAMNAGLSAYDPACPVRARVRSLWDGALIHFLVEVDDSDIATSGKRPGDRDGVEIFLDLFNDKLPKNEEDDMIIRIGSNGEVTGSGPYETRLRSAAAKVNMEGQTVKGYSVEFAIYSGGLSVRDGTAIGIDFGINEAMSSTNTCRNRIFWNNGSNRGLDDNSGWGTLVLGGYNNRKPMVTDLFMLRAAINRAEAVPSGIWNDMGALNKALKEAKAALSATSQLVADNACNELEKSLAGLRRKGMYPDPYDLPAVNHLPDPFTFMNGKRVSSESDWKSRSDEIKQLVQYYEYGFMPQPPASVTARNEGQDLVITVGDKGRMASFKGRLTLPDPEKCGRPGPYPVIVSIDFWTMPANDIYLDAGYGVLSFTYSGVGSDNSEHTGAFYTLYPYDVTTGNDAGTLLAWAWGASRAADALFYLAGKDPEYKGKIDTDKLVVAGFSRCGKAALLAGLLDERFGVVNPGASGCGGAAVYRYESFGNTPARTAPFGNQYSWGSSTGCEVLGDRIRHQGHNHNEMLPRFLNPGRLYKSSTFGYGERLPYDHHEILAAIAPRAVLLTSADDDYANGAEGDCISFEGARPVFRFLGAEEKLGLNLRRTDVNAGPSQGGAHRVDNDQMKNLTAFSDMIFYGKSPEGRFSEELYDNPFLDAMDTYYGGKERMMPWLKEIPDPADVGSLTIDEAVVALKVREAAAPYVKPAGPSPEFPRAFRPPYRSIKPARLFDNLWFVGTGAVGAFLIDTGEGLIMIDTGNGETDAAMMVNDMKTLGLDPSQIKLIMLSHEHFDHYGGVNYLKKNVCPEARVALSLTGWNMLQTVPSEWAYIGDRPESVDIYLTDGMKIRHGNAVITCIATPGHSPGCMSFIFPVYDNGEKHMAGAMGGSAVWPTWTETELYKASVEYFRAFAMDAGCDVGLFIHSREEHFAALRARKPGEPHPLVLGTKGFDTSYLEYFRNRVRQTVESGTITPYNDI